MYKIGKIPTTTIVVETKPVEGEFIEQKVARIMNNEEGITDGAPPMFNERSEGVQALTNVRTDKWDLASEGMDAVAKNALLKRTAAMDELAKKNNPPDPANGGTAEPKV